ncbi:hypothetical protein ABW20_dc0110618 [Dactylellina cionopaga]|nr:hypothetical protein ABW20_dc0110618 [Dactylellina cionopaga]
MPPKRTKKLRPWTKKILEPIRRSRRINKQPQETSSRNSSASTTSNSSAGKEPHGLIDPAGTKPPEQIKNTKMLASMSGIANHWKFEDIADDDPTYAIWAHPPAPIYDDNPDPEEIRSEMTPINVFRNCNNQEARKLGDQMLRALQKRYPLIDVETYAKSGKIDPLQARLDSLAFLLAHPNTHPKEKENIRAIIKDYNTGALTWRLGRRVLYYGGQRRTSAMTEKQWMDFMQTKQANLSEAFGPDGRSWWEGAITAPIHLKYAHTLPTSVKSGGRSLNYYLAFCPVDPNPATTYIRPQGPPPCGFWWWNFLDDTGATSLFLRPSDITSMGIQDNDPSWLGQQTVAFADGSQGTAKSIMLWVSMINYPYDGDDPADFPTAMDCWKVMAVTVAENDNSTRLAGAGVRHFLKTSTDETEPYSLHIGDHRTEVWDSLQPNRLNGVPP